MSFAPDHERSRGSLNGMTVMTEADVVRLREAVAAGTPQRVMAARYGVSESMVSRVILGKDWRHAGGPIKRTITIFEWPDGTRAPATTQPPTHQ